MTPIPVQRPPNRRPLSIQPNQATMIETSNRVLAVQAKRFAASSVALLAGFAIPLWSLLRFSLASDFFSYIPLVPIISAYLIGCNRSKLPKTTHPNWLGTGISFLAGFGLLGVYGWAVHSGQRLEYTAYLALMSASFLLLLLGTAFYFFGAAVLRAVTFPVLFLVFFVPPPEFLLDPVIGFFQQTSAWTAMTMLKMGGTPVLRDELTLRLPDITLLVAPECSGIHSTMVLLMTAFLGGYMFLQTNWRRAILVLFVTPLAIARNGFRIFVIGELCVHVGPRMIDSWVHRHGGPLFFVLSLIPFFLLLAYLRKTESPAKAIAPAPAVVSNIL